MNQKNIFERHPGKTITFFLLFLLLAIDLSAGFLFIPFKEPLKLIRAKNYYYHHGLMPKMSVIDNWGPVSYRLTTNSLGFKDFDTRNVPLVSDNERWVFIGDSFTEGVGVEYKDTFAGIISGALKDKVDILNAAVESYGPVLYYYKVKDLIEQKGLKFDKLFVFIDISDIQDELKYEGFEPDFSKGREWKNDIFRRMQKKWKHFWQTRSFSYFMFREKKRRNDDKHAEIVTPSYTWSSQDEYYFQRDKWASDDKIYQNWGMRGVNLAEDHMKKLISLCRKHDIETVIAVYPWPEQIRTADIRSKQVSIWQRFAKENQAGFINLFPVFFYDSADQVLEQYFIDGDDHWNKPGHKLVAESIMNLIMR